MTRPLTHSVIAIAGSVGVGLLLAFGGAAAAHADPTPPSPTITSTPDELADMVFDALEEGEPTPVPAPPR